MPGNEQRFGGLRTVASRVWQGVSSPQAQAEIHHVAERISNIRISRKAFLTASVAAGAAIDGILWAIQAHPEWFRGAKLRYDFNDVWDEVQAFMHPPSVESLREGCFNKDIPINLSADDLGKLNFYQFGDSMNLVDGIRHNSRGPDQKGSWGTIAAANLQTVANQLGIDTAIQNYNYAQPGASSVGLIGYEHPEGNVQLGAKTIDDMASDRTGGYTPPREQMVNDTGIPVVLLSMNGDDWRNAVDLALGYMEDPAFKKFISSPNINTLTDDVAKKVKNVLEVYQADRKRFQKNYRHALSTLEEINTARLDAGKKPIIVIAPLPINLSDSDNAPYAPLTAPRGTRGHLSLSDYPQSHTAAYRVTSSLYQLINPELQDFAQRSGIIVRTKPMLDLSKDKSLFNDEGHFNDKGETTVGNLITQLFAFDGTLNSGESVSIRFNNHGQANIGRIAELTRRNQAPT